MTDKQETTNKNANQHSFEAVEHALSEMRSGRMVILVDDEDRENEGDLVLAAQFSTPEAINFMAVHGRGLICLAMERDMIERLKLPMMTDENQAPFETAFTVSIEAKTGVTTGISAHDRAHTIQTAIKDGASRADVVVPGHVFPLKARDGGVLVRAGQTEGSVDLSRLAGLKSAAVICEILNEDGSMSRMPQLREFSEKFSIPIVSIADLILYRLHKDQSLIKEVAHSRLPTKFGATFDVRVFESAVDQKEHVALVLGEGDSFSQKTPLVRVHSECLTGDVFGSLRCDCGTQLEAAMRQIAEHGSGVLLYLRQEGRGIGLRNKIRAYELQDQGMDTVEANEALGFAPDLRNYGIGAQILRSLGIHEMKIITNNPRKIVGLDGFGLSVVEQVPIIVGRNLENEKYLDVKKVKLGHLIS
jgi:3,4-dihydroxy 2-butanone 4-phosphate synthase/GTP cyclohydrolase II